MIVRILTEGQWRLDDTVVEQLNGLDDAVEQAVTAGDQDQLATALHALLEQVRGAGEALADDDLEDSDLILPSADATLAEVKELLDETDHQGLIPG